MDERLSLIFLYTVAVYFEKPFFPFHWKFLVLIDKKIPDKVAALDAVYSTLRFATLAVLPLEFVETREPLRSIAGLSDAQIGWQHCLAWMREHGVG